MTNHPNRRRYYAAQSPRGFANEVNVYAFASKSERDEWVSAHADDGDVNAATMGAYVVTKAEAYRIAGPAHDGAGFPIVGTPRATMIKRG